MDTHSEPPEHRADRLASIDKNWEKLILADNEVVEWLKTQTAKVVEEELRRGIMAEGPEGITDSLDLSMMSDARRELARIVGESIGEASVCWEKMDGTGQFNMTRASELVDEVLDAAVTYAETRERTFQEKARQHVFDYVRARLDKTDRHVTFGLDGVYVVWFAKALQNWRCLISTTLPDQMYYEVTYDGNEKVVHLWAYKKLLNGVFPENSEPQIQHVANFEPIQQAKFRVMMYIKHEIPESPESRRFNDWDVKILWLAEVLQNWKAVAVSELTGDLLYEITYNGNKTETYVDVYRKWNDIRISEGEDSIA